MVQNNSDVLSAFLAGRPADLMDLRVAVHQLAFENAVYREVIDYSQLNRNRYSGRINEFWNQDIILEDGTILHHRMERKLPWNVVGQVLLLVKKAANSKLNNKV